MSSKQAKQEEAHRIDVLLNQAAIPLARSRKLIESWLPLSAEEEQDAAAAAIAAGGQGNIALDSSRSDAQLETARPEEFVPRNERAGLGSKAATERSTTTGPRGSGLSAEMEKLRVQLLGRKAASRLSAAAAKTQSSLRRNGHAVNGGRLPEYFDQGGKKRKMQEEDDDDDEEAGRSSVFKSKQQKRALAQPESVPADAKREVNEDGAAMEASSEEDTKNIKVTMGTGSKVYSYLDEILQQRQSKKRKRTKKKKKKQEQQQQQPSPENDT